MKVGTRILKNSVQYGTGTFLLKSLSFILLPIYWQRLEPADWGVVGLSQALLLFLAPIYELGIGNAVLRFYFEWDESKKARVLGTLWILALAFNLTLTLLLDQILVRYLHLILESVPYDPFLRITLWTAFFAEFSIIPVAVMRARNQLNNYLSFMMLVQLTQAAAILLFLFVFEKGVIGFLYGQLIGNGIGAIAYLIYLWRTAKPAFYLSEVREPLKYSIYLVPAGILEASSQTMDRIWLEKFIPLSTLGIYSLGQQFGSIVNVLNNVFKYTLNPIIYKVVSENGDGPKILSKLSNYYLVGLTLPAILVSLFSKELIEIIGKPQYDSIYQTVPLFVFSFFVISLVTAYGRGLDLAKKTQLSFLVPLLALITSILSLSFLVPKWGIFGALFSLVLSNAVRVVAQLALAFHYYPRPVFKKPLVVVFILHFFTIAFCYSFGSPGFLISIAIKSAYFLVALAAIYLLCFDRPQRNQILEYIRFKRLVSGAQT